MHFYEGVFVCLCGFGNWQSDMTTFPAVWPWHLLHSSWASRQDRRNNPGSCLLCFLILLIQVLSVLHIINRSFFSYICWMETEQPIAGTTSFTWWWDNSARGIMTCSSQSHKLRFLWIQQQPRTTQKAPELHRNIFISMLIKQTQKEEIA